jgi:hypothetical protein
MSRGFAALIAYFLGHDYGNPYKVYGLTITSDDFVTGHDNEHGSIFIGDIAELRNNLMRFIAASGLNKKEVDEFQRLFDEHVTSYEHYGGEFNI